MYFYPHQGHFLIALRQEGRERGIGEKHQCEGEASIGCLLYAPGWGIEPAISACELTGNQARNPLVIGRRSNQLSHTSQDAFLFFKGFQGNVCVLFRVNHFYHA